MKNISFLDIKFRSLLNVTTKTCITMFKIMAAILQFSINLGLGFRGWV